MKDKTITELVAEKYRQANTPFDKVMVKWIGWLAVFLTLDKADRVMFANSDKEVELTTNKLTEDINGLARKEGIRNKSKYRRPGDNSSRTKLLLRKDGSKS